MDSGRYIQYKKAILLAQKKHEDKNKKDIIKDKIKVKTKRR